MSSIFATGSGFSLWIEHKKHSACSFYRCMSVFLFMTTGVLENKQPNQGGRDCNLLCFIFKVGRPFIPADFCCHFLLVSAESVTPCFYNNGQGKKKRKTNSQDTTVRMWYVETFRLFNVESPGRMQITWGWTDVSSINALTLTFGSTSCPVAKVSSQLSDTAYVKIIFISLVITISTHFDSL